MVPPPLHVPPPQEAAVVLIHDARAIHDTASLRFTIFRLKGLPDWTVAKLVPDPRSRSATIPGSYVNVDTGKTVSPADAQIVVIKEGIWTRIASAADSAQYTEGRYSWSEGFVETRGVSAEDYYSPFANGGIIVFRYEPTAKGIDQFQSARLIFADWAKEVAPASIFVQSHPGLLENGEQRAPELVHLRQLLADKNKFLVVEAFRDLAESGHLDASLAFEHLTHAEAPLDAILAYLMLSNHSDELAGQVNAAINSSRGEKKLQSIALGAFSALLFRSQDAKILARSKTALQHVRSRVQELKIPLQNDSYLCLILSKAGML